MKRQDTLEMNHRKRVKDQVTNLLETLQPGSSLTVFSKTYPALLLHLVEQLTAEAQAAADVDFGKNPGAAMQMELPLKSE